MSNAVKKINDENFDTTTAKGVTLVDFSAEWCGPCKALNPILESLAVAVNEKVAVAKIDVDESPKAANRFQITSVPTLIIFKNGQEVNRIVGLKDLETLKKIVLGA